MSILEKILAVKKEEVAALKKRFTPASIKESAFFQRKPIRFSERVRNNQALSIIAEIKKASPSKGLIREDFDHKEIAAAYFEQEVSAVSVLTDKQFFSGDIEFMKDVAVFKSAPVLRKDFIIDEIQLLEAKAYGADMVLLICEALSAARIKELTEIANETGLEVLLELHSEDQLEKIDFSLNKIIGVNNRDLNDFSVDLSRTGSISKLLPNGVLVVAESGISKKEDIDYLKSSGADAILVGEHLMRSANLKEKLAELKSWCEYES